MTAPAQASPEQMLKAKAIVKQFYPEVSPFYTGRRLQIALTAILQSDQQQAELVAHAEAMEKALTIADLEVSHGKLGNWSIALNEIRSAVRPPRDAFREYQKGRSDG